jgi:hypothetical protein
MQHGDRPGGWCVSGPERAHHGVCVLSNGGNRGILRSVCDALVEGARVPRGRHERRGAGAEGARRRRGRCCCCEVRLALRAAAAEKQRPEDAGGRAGPVVSTKRDTAHGATRMCPCNQPARARANKHACRRACAAASRRSAGRTRATGRRRFRPSHPMTRRRWRSRVQTPRQRLCAGGQRVRLSSCACVSACRTTGLFSPPPARRCPPRSARCASQRARPRRHGCDGGGRKPRVKHRWSSAVCL